jgi:hypothetical protein
VHQDHLAGQSKPAKIVFAFDIRQTLSIARKRKQLFKSSQGAEKRVETQKHEARVEEEDAKHKKNA